MTATCYCTAPATTGALCTDHLGQLRQHLWAAPEVLRELEITITCQAKQGGNNGTGERAVFNEAAAERKEDLLVVLRSAAHAADPQPRHRFGERPEVLVARALGHVDALARAEGVHTVAQDLADAVVAARQVMDRAAERRVLGQCECGEFVGTRRDEGLARCSACGMEYDIAEWDAGRARLADEARGQVATIPELAVFFTRSLQAEVTARTLQRWAARGLFVPVDAVRPARFRIGDVMDAWESEKGRPLPGRPDVAVRAVQNC